MGFLDKRGLERVWEKWLERLGGKQDILTGRAGQVVGFDAQGKAAAQSTEALVGPAGPQGPQGETGPAGPQGPKGDNGTVITYGTAALVSGTSALETGAIYVQYE